jgi:alkanesulfonate monooxygenase SsuD/methylene tetrahydromethanopterin reductase-like flavin-dependent oxidoreductase (luciferase family)
MKFGVFDHVDRNDTPLKQFYEDRLRLTELYDRKGFYAYHTAEHHSTPLGMSPSPSVFLASVAQRTKNLRLGALVYTLPLYHPLRVAEEICMLDHLSGGRMQVGVGRGISPIEVGYYGVEPEKSHAMYVESFSIVMQALTSDVVNHEGQYYQFHEVPMELRPLQQPHPPLWYGVGNVETVDWCVANNVNAVVNGPPPFVRKITDRFREQWAKAGKPVSQLPLIGSSRHIVVAETDAEAERIGERAYTRWYDSFIFLWEKHGIAPPTAAYPRDFKAACDLGIAVAGSSETVSRILADQIEQVGVNYLLSRFAYGDLSFEESTQSVELFSRNVIPFLVNKFAVAP